MERCGDRRPGGAQGRLFPGRVGTTLGRDPQAYTIRCDGTSAGETSIGGCLFRKRKIPVRSLSLPPILCVPEHTWNAARGVSTMKQRVFNGGNSVESEGVKNQGFPWLIER